MLREWNHHYNWHRPHQGIAGMAPVSRLRTSHHNLLQLYTQFFSPDYLAALGKKIASELGTAGQAFQFKTIQQVAATSVWAAVVANAAKIGGRYAQDGWVAPVDNAPGIGFRVMSHALDAERSQAAVRKKRRTREREILVMNFGSLRGNLQHIVPRWFFFPPAHRIVGFPGTSIR